MLKLIYAKNLCQKFIFGCFFFEKAFWLLANKSPAFCIRPSNIHIRTDLRCQKFLSFIVKFDFTMSFLRVYLVDHHCADLRCQKFLSAKWTCDVKTKFPRSANVWTCEVKNTDIFKTFSNDIFFFS